VEDEKLRERLRTIINDCIESSDVIISNNLEFKEDENKSIDENIKDADSMIDQGEAIIKNLNVLIEKQETIIKTIEKLLKEVKDKNEKNKKNKEEIVRMYNEIIDQKNDLVRRKSEITGNTQEKTEKKIKENERMKIIKGNCGNNLTFEIDMNGIMSIDGIGDMSNYKYISTSDNVNTSWYSKKETSSSITSTTSFRFR